MAILAGYISKKGRLPTNHIRKKISLFSCISNDVLDSYNVQIIPSKFGHIVLRFKKNYPIQYEPAIIGEGSFLAVLGFLKTANSQPNLCNILNKCIDNSSVIIENIEGEFISVLYEFKSNRMHLINDRFGTKPCYYLKTGDSFYFSSNLKFLFSLSSIKPHVDLTGLLQIFSFGNTIGQRTIYRGIKRLLPASHAVIGIDRVNIKNYWSPEHSTDGKHNPKDFAKEVFKRFKSGVEYRSDLVENGVIALSGGLDSRLTAYCLPNKKNYKAFTFIDSTSDSDTIEVNTAKKVASILGIEHHVEFIPTAFVSTVAKDMIYLTGGMRPLTHIIKVMSFINYLNKNGINYFIGGAPGVPGSLVPKSLSCISPDSIQEGINLFYNYLLSSKNIKEYLLEIFKKEVVEEYHASIKKGFFNSIEHLKGPTAAHKITAWSLLYRNPGFTLTTPIHDHPDITETFSLLDYNFCDLMLRIPADWLYDKNFYKYMIFENLTELRDVIYANSGKILLGRIQEYHFAKPTKFSALKKNFISNLKRTNMGNYLFSSMKNIKNRFNSQKEVTHSPPGFLYQIFKEDQRLFNDLNNAVESIPEINSVVDIEKCNSFFQKFAEGKTITGDLNKDTELLGKISAFFYSFKFLNRF